MQSNSMTVTHTTIREIAARQGYDDTKKILEAFPSFRHLREQEEASNDENQCPASKQLSEPEVIDQDEES